jgi:hypothetical protein
MNAAPAVAAAVRQELSGVVVSIDGEVFGASTRVCGQPI